MSAFVYILRCSDRSYYVGSARGETLDKRIGEHQSGATGGYTASRLPVELAYAEHFQSITDAIVAERRIKGWSRAKKEALIAGNWNQVRFLAKRPSVRHSTIANTQPPHPEVLGAPEPRRTQNDYAYFETGLQPAPRHEDRGG